MVNTTDIPIVVTCSGCQAQLDGAGIPGFTTVYCPECGRQLTVPQRFANLLLQDVIGIGPAATVYRATDPTLRREVAVRVVAEHLCKRPGYVALFLSQARKNAALVNSAVLPVYDCGEWEGQAYITMQYMADLGLDAHWGTPTEPPDLGFCLDTMIAVASAVDSAWQSGVLHHNLSPHNILFDDDMNVKTADFGLAYAGWRPAATPTENLQTTCASAMYVSPEKGLTGKQDGRGDIYSMGAIFYHWLTGTPPFPDSCAATEFGRRVMEPLVPPQMIRRDLPEGLNALVVQMLAVSPENRPQTSRIVLDALTAARRGPEDGHTSGRRPGGSAAPLRGPGPAGRVAFKPRKLVTLGRPVEPRAGTRLRVRSARHEG